MFTNLDNEYYNLYVNKRRMINLFITFIFVVFFFEFSRKIFIKEPFNQRISLIRIICFLMWYCLSLIFI